MIILSRRKAEAPTVRPAARHGVLDFIGKAAEVPVQTIGHVTLGVVRGEVAAQCGLRRVPAKPFERSLIILSS